LIIITNDFQKALQEINADETILKDELKVDDVREIKKLAYITETKEKTIAIAAKKYNIYAQNALLKLLEEPPKNVKFILLTPSKYILLDTILSRMPLKKMMFHTEDEGFDIGRLNNERILELLKEDIQKDKIKFLLKNALNNDLNEDELSLINDFYLMLELNIDKKSVLTLLLLMLKDKR